MELKIVLDAQNFEWKQMWFCKFAQVYIPIILFSVWDESRDTGANWSNLEHIYTIKEGRCKFFEVYTSHINRQIAKNDGAYWSNFLPRRWK